MAAEHFFQKSSKKNIETEVKFFIKDAGSLRNNILKTGAVSRGRFFETNIRFEDAHNSLIQKKSLLRLRKDSKATLTFKSERSTRKDQFKIHHELEVEVNDFDRMALILESLGFHKAQIYEKWRETFVFNETLLCLDTLPFGNFLEIEGDRKGIKAVTDQLNFDWKKESC